MNLNVAIGQHSHRDVWHTKPCSLTTTLVILCFGVCVPAREHIFPSLLTPLMVLLLPHFLLNGPGQWVSSEDANPIYCVTVCFTDTCLLAKTPVPPANKMRQCSLFSKDSYIHTRKCFLKIWFGPVVYFN